jgi:predicted ribosomally synthesized peptide with SipW-like signal peptide
MTERYQLSRRKALAGLATIGAAGAGAGLGTSALFTDEEVTEDNVVKAGTQDMSVTATPVAANDEYLQLSSNPVDHATSIDGGVKTVYNLIDFKPGDWVAVQYEVSISSNPGYVAIHGGNVSESGGDTTDPEKVADENTDDDADNGALGDKLLMTHWNDYTGDTSDPSTGSRTDLAELSQTTNKVNRDPQSGAYGNPDVDGNADVGGNNAEYTDVREFMFGIDQDPTNEGGVPNSTTQLGNGYASTDGVAIRWGGGIGAPGNVPNGEQPYRIVGDGSQYDPLVFYQLIELPKEVGNVVQGDELTFDLGFVSVQSRNNSGPDRSYPFSSQTA